MVGEIFSWVYPITLLALILWPLIDYFIEKRRKRKRFIKRMVNDAFIEIETDDERMADCIAECLETDSFVCHTYDENGKRIK